MQFQGDLVEFVLFRVFLGGGVEQTSAVITQTPLKLNHSTVSNVYQRLFHLTQIAAIASRSLERAEEFAKRHGIPKAYGSYEALAKDPNIGEA